MDPVQIEISHVINFEFSQPVFLEPHWFQLQPRADGGQTPTEFRLEIDPHPTGMSAYPDAAGNIVTQAWFDDMHTSLSVSMHAVVDMLRENPFDFFVDRNRTLLPADYADDAELLRPYLRREPREANAVDEVAVFAARMSHAARGELVPMLTSLNRALFDRFESAARDEGPPWPAERTWQVKRGACRDLAVLFVDVCRALGVAARFVSGYEQCCGGAPAQLHAWAEAYIPGAGWRGYDPSRGLAVGQSHVAVAAAAAPADAAPIIGSFRGTSATSTMDAHIRIERRCAIAV